MLTVSTYLDRSALNGIGLFAAEDIQKDGIVWEFSPGIDLVFTVQEWKGLLARAAPPARRALRRYSYKSDNLLYLCLDNAQFMNHGGGMKNIGNNRNKDTMHALRDIAAGEELLCDYFEYSDADDFHLDLIPPPGTAVTIRSRRRRSRSTAG